MANVYRYKGQTAIKFDGEKRVRKDEVYGSHRSCFTDIPYYYGAPFTERELQIIAGEKVNNFRRLDVTKIMRKAESLGQYDIAEKVYDMYGYFFHEVHEGDPAVKDALDILDSLTPDDLK